MQRKILFNLSFIKEEDLNHIGIYKITNMITNDFYIGSADRNFRERFKEHCRCYELYLLDNTRHIQTPILWRAYNKYNISNFKVEILEILDNCSYQEILEREEYYINILNPKYNVCKYPSKGGKPNLNRKLDINWKNNIKIKNQNYKHSKEVLMKITKNNKDNATKLEFNNETNVLNFNSWIEAANYFKVNVNCLRTAYNRNHKWKGWNIIKLSSQKKKIKVFLENKEIIFDSYSECDKYFNMWKGYTSNLVNKSDNSLLIDKYTFQIL